MARSSVLSLLLACLLLAVPAQAKDPDFQRIVGQVSAHYHRQDFWGMGFVMWLAGRHIRHELGVSHLKMAIFEGRTSPLDADFEKVVAEAAGPGFQPFVRVASQASREVTLIYARPKGEQMELLLVSADDSDAVVMRMTIEPEAMAKWMDNPDHMARRTRKG